MKTLIATIVVLNLAFTLTRSQDYLNTLNTKIAEQLDNANEKINAEIEKTLDSLMQYTSEKHLDSVLSFYDSSKDFIYISDGSPITFKQVKQSYIDFFEQLDFIADYRGISTIVILNPIQVHCIWHGYEKVKLSNLKLTETNWTSSLLFEKRHGRWIITQVHTSHY